MNNKNKARRWRAGFTTDDYVLSINIRIRFPLTLGDRKKLPRPSRQVPAIEPTLIHEPVAGSKEFFVALNIDAIKCSFGTSIQPISRPHLIEKGERLCVLTITYCSLSADQIHFLPSDKRCWRDIFRVFILVHKDRRISFYC